MLIITDQIYLVLAKLLIENIGQKYIFSGSIEYDTDELYSTLITTVVIDKKRVSESDGSHDVITAITPVWWEFKTYQRDGEVCNTFSWQEFVEFLPIDRVESRKAN